MYAPTTFGASIVLMFLTMIFWGSWVSAFSLCRGKYRFELFYWDYAVGVLLGTVALAAVLGLQSAVFGGEMAPANVAFALLAGALFNIGNVLLVAAISITGMAVAFPACIGLALMIGVGISWYVLPAVPAVPMAIGVLLILLSMIMDAAAYRAAAKETVFSPRGVIIAVIGGLFIAAYAPCLQKAMLGPTALDAYAASVMVAVGILGCTMVTNYFFMRWPIAGGPPVTFRQLFTAPLAHHVLGIVGGVIWAAGTVLNLIAADKASMAVSYSFGVGGTLVAALWGVFVWKEFQGAPRRSYYYLLGMFGLFGAGIGVIAYAKALIEST